MNSDNNTIVFIDYRNLLARNSMVTRDVDRRMHTRTEEVNLGSDVLQTRTVELQIPTFQQDVLEATRVKILDNAGKKHVKVLMLLQLS